MSIRCKVVTENVKNVIPQTPGILGNNISDRDCLRTSCDSVNFTESGLALDNRDLYWGGSTGCTRGITGGTRRLVQHGVVMAMENAIST